MILIISICKEKLHEYEFVKPVKSVAGKYRIVHYSKLKESDLKEAGKIIICGTSLRDDEFISDIQEFKWIKTSDKPVLGICGGMEIIGLLFEGELKKGKEIGFYKENFVKDFLGLKRKQQVYHLHKNYVTLPKEFEKFTDSEIPQAIKHRNKEIYGVLFHPEVRNRELIGDFVK